MSEFRQLEKILKPPLNSAYIHNWSLQSYSQDYDLASYITYAGCCKFIHKWRCLKFRFIEAFSWLLPLNSKPTNPSMTYRRPSSITWHYNFSRKKPSSVELSEKTPCFLWGSKIFDCVLLIFWIIKYCLALQNQRLNLKKKKKGKQTTANRRGERGRE